MTKDELKKTLDFVCRARERLHNEKEELQQRIDKAIEYIKTCNPDVDINSMFLNESYISNYGAKEILEILEGKE